MIDFEMDLDRLQFEEIASHIFDKCIPPIIEALDQAIMSKEEINEVILVGGSTRIPKVRNLLKQYFGKEVNCSLDPDTAVAMGATIQAGILSGQNANALTP